jgi:predicted HNH restriction endonuclease
MSRNREKVRLRNAQRAYAVALKGGKCEQCGVRYHPEIYDFHAPNGHADKKVSNLYGGKLKRVITEAKQCNLLCPTCHRIVHVEGRDEQS